MPLSKNVPAESVFQSCSVFCLLVTPQTLDGQKFLGVDKQVIIIWCKVGTVWRMLKNFLLELLMCSLYSLSCTHHLHLLHFTQNWTIC